MNNIDNKYYKINNLHEFTVQLPITIFILKFKFHKLSVTF